MGKALIVVDMQKDNMFREAYSIVPKIRRLISEARRRRIPVVYACDTRHPEDLLFKRIGMKPHAIKGTEGWKIIEELKPEEGDLIIEKRMLSAFFGTSLDSILREKNVDSLVIVGIATDVCLLKTALDAFELGYEVTVPPDGCAALTRERHEAALKILEALKVRMVPVEEAASNL
ncbi:MAG: cysteine hydrolase [Candidatus Hecatellales archaeon]|nr:MAG: cysteine hydrolase [Candidatus Hecatellales archaeon]